MLAAHPGLVEVDEDLEDEFASYLLVDKRYHMAREIMAGGKYSAKKDPDGPEPPLQMPAWKYILSEKDMDSLLAYFVSLQPWDDEEFDADEEYDQ